MLYQISEQQNGLTSQYQIRDQSHLMILNFCPTFRHFTLLTDEKSIFFVRVFSKFTLAPYSVITLEVFNL
jgi:hypothetical protein